MKTREMKTTPNITLKSLAVLAGLLALCCPVNLQAALVSHWTFDGNGDDIGTNNLDVSLVGDATYGAGQFGQALYLDGDGDKATRASSNPLAATNADFTISLWAYQENLSPTTQRYIGWGLGRASGRAFMGPYSTNDGKVDVGFGGTRASFSNASALPVVNTWQHWTFVRSGTDAILYLNGSEIQTLTVGATVAVAGTDTLNIGAQYGAFNEYFNGRLDDVAIWDEALDTTQIGNVVNFGAGNYAIPEPSTVSMGLLAGLLIACRRQRA